MARATTPHSIFSNHRANGFFLTEYFFRARLNFLAIANYANDLEPVIVLIIVNKFIQVVAPPVCYLSRISLGRRIATGWRHLLSWK